MWVEALDEDALQERFSELPAGVATWDFTDPQFFALTKELRTFLRACAGVPHIGARKDVAGELTSKLRRVVDDVRELEGKCVVFSQYMDAVHTVSLVLQRAGIKSVNLAVGMRSAALSAAVRAFNTDPECKALIMHASTSAAGLTLTAARTVLLLEPFNSAGQEAQAMNRVHRIGQTHDVVTRTYFMRDTIEERVLAWRGVGKVKQGADLTVLAGDPAKSVGKISLSFCAFSLGVEESTGSGEMFDVRVGSGKKKQAAAATTTRQAQRKRARRRAGSMDDDDDDDDDGSADEG